MSKHSKKRNGNSTPSENRSEASGPPSHSSEQALSKTERIALDSVAASVPLSLTQTTRKSAVCSSRLVVFGVIPVPHREEPHRPQWQAARIIIERGKVVDAEPTSLDSYPTLDHAYLHLENDLAAWSREAQARSAKENGWTP